MHLCEMLEVNVVDKNEMFHSTVPKDDIICKDCLFRMNDVEVIGKLVRRHTYGQCDVFTYPDTKPMAVLFEGANCPFYKHDDEL